MLALVLECGKYGVDVLALLDKANTETYGNPELSKVNIGVGKNPGILVSRHDLKDIEDVFDFLADVFRSLFHSFANFFRFFTNIF